MPRSRPRGDNPRTGTAIPREGRPPRPWQSGPVYVPPIYNDPYYYYYPRPYSPYGYGGFGLGYFYYDPWGWPGSSWNNYWNDGRYGWSGQYDRDRERTGELRLDVRPREADVFVDGYWAGRVDDFDGMFQGLKLEEGRYHIRIEAPGYEPLEFDAQIVQGRKIKYTNELRRRD